MGALASAPSLTPMDQDVSYALEHQEHPLGDIQMTIVFQTQAMGILYRQEKLLTDGLEQHGITYSMLHLLLTLM